MGVFRKGYKKERDCSVAIKPINAPRNRYRDILPYDDTRVKLSAEQDYINANRVHMEAGPAALRYIASQGPKEATAGHFWQMVWEQGVSVICMLTSLVEASRPKCFQYWPTTGAQEHDSGLTVTLAAETEVAGHTRRTLEVTRGDEKRTVNLVQFSQWPDHGVPDEYVCSVCVCALCAFVCA